MDPTGWKIENHISYAEDRRNILSFDIVGGQSTFAVRSWYDGRKAIGWDERLATQIVQELQKESSGQADRVAAACSRGFALP